MKKVWIFNHYANEMYRNKGGRHFSFAEKLVDRGYEPIIFCSNTFHTTGDQFNFDGNFLIDKTYAFPFVFLKTKNSIGNGVKRVWNMYSFYQNLMKNYKTLVREIGEPDFILASSVHPLTLVAGIRIAKKLKVPCICEVRDLWPEAIFAFSRINENGPIGKCLKLGEKWIYEKADALIFTKEGDTDYLSEQKWLTTQSGHISLNKCFYINNGVDIKSFEDSKINNAYHDSIIDSNSYKVIYCGSIRPVNDISKLVEAGKKMLDDNIQILIYGEGSEKELLMQKVITENISNVFFLGAVPKENIPSILSKSSLNILNYSQTSYNWSRGNSSNKLFEYLAAGKPVLSTVEMGYSIINRYQCGIELDDPTPEMIAKTIIEFKNMEKSKYKMYCDNALIAAKEFDFEKLTDKLVEVFNFVTT